jgi:hypothetical protein
MFYPSAAEREIEFGGQFDGVKRAARKKMLSFLDGGDLAAAVIDPENEVFGVGVFLNVDFAKGYSAILQEVLGAAAVRAPGGAVNYDGFHI